MFSKYVTNTYEIKDTYRQILLDGKDASVKIEPSEDNKTNLVCFEKKKRPYEFSIQDGTLAITPKRRGLFSFLRIGINRSKISLCVPKSTLETISVNTNVGSVNISSIVCSGTVDIQVNTGKVNICDVSCKDFNSKGNTGTITLDKLLAKDSVTIKRNTGKVLLTDCNSREFFIKTNTGSVCGKLPTGTVFVTKTNTGTTELPKNLGDTITGRCEIKTNTGNIKFE